MGLERVEWGDTRCDERPYAPHTHHWISVAKVDGGTTFMCKYCHRVRWYPSSWDETLKFNDRIWKYGEDEAYRLMLLDHPTAAKQILKLSDLRNIRKHIKDDDAFRDMIVIISRSKDYD